MIDGAPSKMWILAAKYSATGQLNRVKHKARDVPEGSYRSFYAGQMWIINCKLDAVLDAFGVEVKDGEI